MRLPAQAQGQDAPPTRSRPLLGKHVFELRVSSDRLDLKKARGMLRLEPAQGAPILHALHFENPSVSEPAPAGASTRTLRLGADGPSATLTMLRPPTSFAGMPARKSPVPAADRPGYFFVDLFFDRPDPQFKAVLTLEADDRIHRAEFEYPWGEARTEAK